MSNHLETGTVKHRRLYRSIYRTVELFGLVIIFLVLAFALSQGG